MNNKIVKSNNKSHLNDFSVNVSGEYEYIGSTYRLCDNNNQSLASLKRKLTLIGILTLGFLLLSGSLPIEAMLQVPYVVIPYMLSVVVAFRFLYIIIRFILSTYPLRQYIYEETFCKLHDTAMITITFIIMTLIGFTIYTIFNGFSKSLPLTLLFITSEIAPILILFYQNKLIDSIKWEKVS